MSGQVFVDASALLALADPSSPDHGRAVELLSHLDGPLVTSNLVLIRTTAEIVRRSNRAKAAELLSHFDKDDGLKVLHVDAEVERKGWELFRKETGQDLDPLNAMSFALMRELGIRMVFTFQTAFRDAGYITVPMSG